MTETTDEKAIPKRDQVLELLKEGTYTREEMAAKLGMSVASVNSQFTYLRWMRNFIKYDDDKKLSLCTEEEYIAWEASKKAATKKSTAKPKSPQDAYAAATKALAADTKNLAAWEAKLVTAKAAYDEDTSDETLQDNFSEATAMVTLLKLKVKRGTKKLADLPEPEVIEEEVEEEVEVTEEDDII